MSRSSFSSSLVVVVGGVLVSAGLGGCGAGAGLKAGSASTLDAALESCDALLADADAAAQGLEADCAADPACDVDASNARIAQLYADAQASCDALVAQDADLADDDSDEADGDDGDDGHKVTICHSTGSAHHPYVIINVDQHAIPAHERHHDGRDIIPAPADGCPAADDGDGDDDGPGHGHGGGHDDGDGGNDGGNDGEDGGNDGGNDGEDGGNDGGEGGEDGGNDGGEGGNGGGDAPDCTALRAEADAAIADATAERDAACAFDAENGCPAANLTFDDAVATIEADYAAVCGSGPIIAE